MTHSHSEKEMQTQFRDLSKRYHIDALTFPRDNTSITKQNHSRKNITKYLCSCFPHTHTHRQHKHSESLLLSEMKLTPLICSRKLTRAALPPKNPSDPPLWPQGQLLQPANPLSVSQSTSPQPLFLSPTVFLNQTEQHWLSLKQHCSCEIKAITVERMRK